MKYRLLVLILIILTTGKIYCQSELPIFLTGTWKMENKETFEHWDIISAERMKGFSYKVLDSRVYVSEYIDIKIKGNEIFYSAIVPDQNQGSAIDFKLTKADSIYVFENPEHDFPKKIIYHKLSDTKINVEVSDGKKGFSYKMNKLSDKLVGISK